MPSTFPTTRDNFPTNKSAASKAALGPAFTAVGTTLTAQATSGATALTVADTNGAVVGETLTIGEGGTQEAKVVDSIPNGTTINLTAPLANTHASGAPVLSQTGDHARHHNDLADAVNKLEAWLGSAAERTVFNVRYYGATGDGVTNDTAAIQAAIDAAEANGGGIVYTPEGTYICHGLTIESSNISFMGCGWGSCWKQVSGVADNTHMITCLGTTTDTTGNYVDLNFRYMQFQGRIDTDVATQYVHLVALSGVTHASFEKCLFKGWRGDGLYMGSGIGTQVERHNEHIIVKDCTFDGVNKLNRNAITFIDGTNGYIENCAFRNCTATDRPGAIDLEMNANAYHRMRNIHVRRCNFDNVGGNVGNIILDITPTQATLTTDVHGIYFCDNTIRNTTSSQSGIFIRQRQTPTATDTYQNIVVKGNHIIDVNDGSPMYIEGVRGVKVTENFIGTSELSLTLGYAHNVMDVEFENNTLEKTASAGASPEGTAISIYGVTRLKIKGNTFDNIGLTDGTSRRLTSFNYNSGNPSVSSEITFTGNRVIGTATTISGKAASHTLDRATNKYFHNDVPTNLVPSVDHWSGVHQTTHTWAVMGDTASTATLPSFFVSREGRYQHVRLVKARYKISAGTSLTWKVTRTTSGGTTTDAIGTTAAPITASTTTAETTLATPLALTNNDELDLVPVGGGPGTDLVVTVTLEHL